MDPTAVPEPSTWVMMLVGLVGIGSAAYRRSRKDRFAPTFT
jgi:PEP-CTERM motif